jgi:hypothetical protein
MPATCTAIKNQLQVYLGRYFDAVNTDISFSEEDPDKSSSQVRIKLAITVSEKGSDYQVTRLIRAIDGKFKEFITLNNESTTS